MNTIYVTAALALVLILWCCKSRLLLALAVKREHMMRGVISQTAVSLPPGQTKCISSFIDALDDWAGHIYVGRNLDGTYYVLCQRGRYRSGPSDGQAIYVNGRKVHAYEKVDIKRGDNVLLRQTYNNPPIVALRAAFN